MSLTTSAGRIAVHGLVHRIAGALQPVDHQVAHDRVIVDDQDFRAVVVTVAQVPISQGDNCV
jgi:hypothetical protein